MSESEALRLVAERPGSAQDAWWLLADGRVGAGPNVWQAQTDLWAQGGGHLVMFDDNLASIRLGGRAPTRESFAQFLEHCWLTCVRQRVAGWSAHPCSNTFGVAHELLQDAVGGQLKLCYGAMFGMTIISSAHWRFVTVFGNMLDDVERSIL